MPSRAELRQAEPASATREIDAEPYAGETLQGLASKPRVAGTATEGTLVPFAEVDIRTSIRPTVAEIDLGAVQRNLSRFRRVIGPSVAVFGVVKADAYGHGAVPVARALEPLCNALAVSLVEEGLELRAAGVRAPIFVLGAYYNRHQDDVIAQRLTPVVYDLGDLERFGAAAARRGRRIDVHVKVDTGMSRLGVSVDDLPAVLARFDDLSALRLAGLCTHFASADLPDASVTEQALDKFDACIGEAMHAGFTELAHHAANSAAAIRFPRARYAAVRPGLALFGAMPSRHVAVADLEPALRLSTRIMAVHDVPVGTPVSYGGLWRAPRPSRIATLPVGYADGYPRHVRDACALVGGRRVPIVGAVCMDMLMVDVTDVPPADAGLGSVVTLIGRDGAEQITVDDVAGWAGTLSYEILCGISKRVPRIQRDAAIVSTPRP
ncbi:MAG TPA: alanine racemase [Polyangia bacterium]|nr:alanine racemase [Polyangia bacterium]